MATGACDEFDASSYLSCPRLTAEGAVALGRALLELTPAKSPAHVTCAATRLQTAVSATSAALVERGRQLEPAQTHDEMRLDQATDAMWSVLRGRLESWLAFDHDVLDTLVLGASANRVSKELLQAQQRASRARALLAKLFGSTGLTFLDKPWPEQAETTRRILQMIRDDGLQAAITELCGPEVLNALELLQARYEAMVQLRVACTVPTTQNIRVLRSQLQHFIIGYCAAVLTMSDADHEGSIDVVRAALRPMEALRSSQPKPPAPAPSPDPSTHVDPWATTLPARAAIL